MPVGWIGIFIAQQDRRLSGKSVISDVINSNILEVIIIMQFEVGGRRIVSMSM
jgi:hypothetical protein